MESKPVEFRRSLAYCKSQNACPTAFICLRGERGKENEPSSTISPLLLGARDFFNVKFKSLRRTS